jgi:hypothetical protein
MYKLTITKVVDNPNYKAELKEWQDSAWRIANFGSEGGPIPTIEENTLFVILTDEEYEVVKKEVLKTFK